MVKSENDNKTRQIFASVREDLYLAAKARATELRIPLREFIEQALELSLSRRSRNTQAEPSIWDDDYLRMQAEQAIGSPVELTGEEAERVVRAAFGSVRVGEAAAGDMRSDELERTSVDG